MHLLATTAMTLDEAEAAVDLGQTPAEVVVLSFSDSDLSALAAAWHADRDVLPTLRLASLKRLKHPMSVDLYLDRVAREARCVVVRCLGGLDYWRYGFERLPPPPGPQARRVPAAAGSRPTRRRSRRAWRLLAARAWPRSPWRSRVSRTLPPPRSCAP